MISFAFAAALLAAAPSPVSAADVSVSSAPVDAMTLTLDQAYAAALKRSEEVAEKGETYAQVLAEIDELWAAVKPKLNLNAAQFWEDTPGPNVNFPLPAAQTTAAVNAHQPLFSGLREFLAVKVSKAQGEAAELTFERAKQLLYQDVASAYLNLLESHRDIATHRDQVMLDAGRIKELRNFADLGRSRESEVLAAESQEAQDRADLETTRGQERLYQETLRFLTGLDQDLEPQEIAEPTAAEDAAPFLARAERRPDVEAARRTLESSDLYVSIQRRQYWPTIYADANYYLIRPNNFYQHVNWDATLTGQLPLYYGGQIGAQVREAQAQRRFNEQALSLALRTAELDVKSAHSDLVSDLSIVKSLENAMTLAEANAKAQAADYRHGQVTNIDVLTALTTVETTRLRLDQARIQAYDARVRLEVAAGGPGSAQ